MARIMQALVEYKNDYESDARSLNDEKHQNKTVSFKLTMTFSF